MKQDTTQAYPKWYEAKTGNHQGLIIDEQTGESIAVSYKKEDAKLIATAPELAKALQDLIQYLEWREDFIVEDAGNGEKNAFSNAKQVLKDAGLETE